MSRIPEGLRPDLYYTTTQIAELLGLRPHTLENWRSTRNGPSYVKPSARMVRYNGTDVIAWLDTFRGDAPDAAA